MSLMSVAYYDAHFDADSIKIARGLAAEQQIANVRFEVADLYALPFPDATFDVAKAPDFKKTVV